MASFIAWLFPFSVGRPVISVPNNREFTAPTVSDLVIPLTITGTSPDVDVYRNGELVNSPRIQYRITRTLFELIFYDLQQADAGEYRIVATNSDGSDEAIITVTPDGM